VFGTWHLERVLLVFWAKNMEVLLREPAGLSGSSDFAGDLKAVVHRLRSDPDLFLRLNPKAFVRDVRALAVEKQQAAKEARSAAKGRKGLSDEGESADECADESADEDGEETTSTETAEEEALSKAVSSDEAALAQRYRKVLVACFVVSHAAGGSSNASEAPAAESAGFLFESFAGSNSQRNSDDRNNVPLLDALANLLEESWLTARPELVAAVSAALLRFLGCLETVLGPKLNRVWSRLLDAVEMHAHRAVVALEFCRGCEVIGLLIGV